MKWLSQVLLSMAVLGVGFEANAFEIMVYGGSLTHKAINGCCTSSGMETGGGVLGRMNLSQLGDMELAGYSDGRWSEGALLKPLYLFGRTRGNDPQSSPLLKVQTVSDWRWISSVGLGYFTHSARTVNFDLPVLITGFEAINFNQFLYTINDRWSAGGILQLSLALSASDLSYLIGTHLTIGYYFK